MLSSICVAIGSPVIKAPAQLLVVTSVRHSGDESPFKNSSQNPKTICQDRVDRWDQGPPERSFARAGALMPSPGHTWQGASEIGT